jgi:NitT/TauT family transport system substrate-binding protein
MKGEGRTLRVSKGLAAPLKSLLAAATLLLAACSPAAAPTATAPAVQATTAPAAAAGAAAKPTTAAAQAASAPAAGQAGGAPAAGGGGLIHIKMAATTGSSGNAPVYIAIERGYFKDQGVEVETVDFPGGAQMIPAIAASQVDVANTDAGAGLINAIAHNLPAKFVADGASCTVGHCTASFLVRKALVDSGGYKDISDLRGKSVNTFTPGSTLYMYTYRMLQKAGLTDSDINGQALTFDQVSPAFVTSALDASWQIDPFTTQSVLSGTGTKVGDAADILGPQQSTVILYSPNFASQQQDAGKKFMVAYLKGVRDYDAAFVDGKDKDAIISILTKYTSVKDPTVFEKIGMPNFDRNGKIIIDSLKANQDWYVGHGDIPTPVNLDQVYDTTYIDYANGVLGG